MTSIFTSWQWFALSIYLEKEIIESIMQAIMRWIFSLVVCGLLWGSVGKAETVQAKNDTVNAGTAIHLTADAKAEGKPLIHFWSKVVGAGRANEGLRSTWQEELETAGKFDGFQYVRFPRFFQETI